MPTLVGLWGYQRGVLRHRKGRWPAGPVLLPIVPCGWAEKHCCGKRIAIYRWLGVRWYGVPMPVRVWRRVANKEPLKSHNGCGCIVKLKVAMIILKRSWKQWKAA